MMEKVILTREQANAVEELKCIHLDLSIDEACEILIQEKAEDGNWSLTEFKAANSISLINFTKALLIGYEIEQPPFAAGNWVVRTVTIDDDKQWKKGYVFKIDRLDDNGQVCEKNGRGHRIDSVRHATKEEAFWAELGRESIGKFVDDDLILFKDGTVGIVEKRNEKLTVIAKDEYLKGNLKGFYPAESYVKFPQ